MTPFTPFADSLAPVYLTTRDVARRLGVHPQTVRRWIASGRLPATRIGKDYRISRADLDAARNAR
jgi:excisionase family DNA binding protein